MVFGIGSIHVSPPALISRNIPRTEGIKKFGVHGNKFVKKFNATKILQRDLKFHMPTIHVQGPREVASMISSSVAHNTAVANGTKAIQEAAENVQATAEAGVRETTHAVHHGMRAAEDGLGNIPASAGNAAGSIAAGAGTVGGQVAHGFSEGFFQGGGGQLFPGYTILEKLQELISRILSPLTGK